MFCNVLRCEKRRDKRFNTRFVGVVVTLPISSHQAFFPTSTFDFLF